MLTGGEGGANTDGERMQEAITIMMHEPQPQPSRSAAIQRGSVGPDAWPSHCEADGVRCGWVGWCGCLENDGGDDEDGGGCEWTLDIGHGGALDCRRRG
jgi:hypothetical protein